MVSNVTSLTGSGLRDWLIQRASAWVIAAYTVLMIVFMMCNAPMTYQAWHQFFNHELVRVATISFLVALILHAWIGVWTITTDYIKCTNLRIAVQGAFIFMFIASFVWGVDIFWGM